MLTGLFGRTSLLRQLLPRLAVSRRNVILAGDGASDTSAVVEWLSGACMLARRDALAAVRGFDPRYFLYREDADLCRRLRTHGYHVRYVSGATAVHYVGHSSRTARSASIRAFHESAYLYYSTHVAPGAYNPKRWLARLLLTLRCWWRLRQNPGDEPRHVLRDRQARREAWRFDACRLHQARVPASSPIRKSANDCSGGWSFGRMPLPPRRRSVERELRQQLLRRLEEVLERNAVSFVVVLAVLEADRRAERHVAVDRLGEMHAKAVAVCMRQRIDEAVHEAALRRARAPRTRRGTGRW